MLSNLCALKGLRGLVWGLLRCVYFAVDQEKEMECGQVSCDVAACVWAGWGWRKRGEIGSKVKQTARHLSRFCVLRNTQNVKGAWQVHANLSMRTSQRQTANPNLRRQTNLVCRRYCALFANIACLLARCLARSLACMVVCLSACLPI